MLMQGMIMPSERILFVDLEKQIELERVDDEEFEDADASTNSEMENEHGIKKDYSKPIIIILVLLLAIVAYFSQF